MYFNDDETLDSLTEKYQKKYKGPMAQLAKSPLQKNRPHGITQWDICGLGRQLDSFSRQLNEEKSSMSHLDILPRIGIDVITANYGISPIALIAGVQPIKEEIGIVWFEDFVAQNTRGNVTAGQKLITSLTAPEVNPENYSSDTLLTSNFVHASNGAQTYTAVSMGGTDDVIAPIDNQRITIYGSTIFNGGADTVNWPVMTPDPKTGEFGGTKVVNSTLYSIFGTVNFNAGTVSLQFSADPSGQTDIFADFAVSLEAAPDIVRSILTYQSKQVKTRFFAMASTYGLFQSFVSTQRFGQNFADVMTKKLVQSLNNEITNLLISKLSSIVPNNNKKVWKRQPGNGIDYVSHKLALPDFLVDTSKTITKSAQRGHANVWIGGISACAVLETMPGFTKTFDDLTFGPHVFGNYKGATIVRVPSDALLDEDVLLGTYQGASPFEAPVVWCPYMPLTITPDMIFGDNPLQYQKAAAMSGVIESMIPNFVCQLTIDQTDFDGNAY